MLAWRFTAGERITTDKNIFGDRKVFSTFLSGLFATPLAGLLQQSQAPAVQADALPDAQVVAIFSNSSISMQDGEVVLSFLGRRGPQVGGLGRRAG
jgi:hypothetical protein